jgi:2'-5' RNA ligase
MVETKRVFIAINLPVELKEKIFSELSRIIPEKTCKIVEKENLHFTLAFLGNQTISEIEKIKQKMLALSTEKPFKIELSGIGTFNKRVFWLGLKEGNKEIAEIAKRLHFLLGFQEEKFSPHLTIARNKSFQAKEAELLIKKLQEKNFCAGFVVKSIDLMESVLSQHRPTYEKLFSVSIS